MMPEAFRTKAYKRNYVESFFFAEMQEYSGQQGKVINSLLSTFIR